MSGVPSARETFEDAQYSGGMHQPVMEPSSGVLDFSDASIGHTTADEVDGRHTRKDAPCIVLPHQSQYISHIALDIGGSLIKLIYFSMDDEAHPGEACRGTGEDEGDSHHAQQHHHHRRAGGGKLHFVKFETSKVEQCMDFIESKGLHKVSSGNGAPMRVKATGGGAYKYADRFKQRLGLILEREDEMACMVDGCNFLLKAVRHEALLYENSKISFVHLHSGELYPYLLVNIGSGVSMVRVDGEGKFQRVSGTNIGGGTFWGLCRLLTGLANFDEILELSSHGDNSKVDMLVGDIYGGRDYTGIGLSANTIASSFGKVLYENKELTSYNPADIALSLCRMISYNIGQLAYLNAKRYNLSRIFFGGFFIRGHPYTMETISFAIRFWSKGEMAALFLRHEGFLGAVGAFMKVQAMTPLTSTAEKDAGKVRARFVERFKMGAPVMGGEVHGPAMHDMRDKLDWVEKFIAAGRPASEIAREEHERAQQQQLDFKRKASLGADMGEGDGGGYPAVGYSPRHPSSGGTPKQSTGGRLKFHVGVLQFSPHSEPFALLADPVQYEPNTININTDREEMEYWAGVLLDQVPNVVEKAYTSEGATKEAQRRAAAFGRALDLHLTKLREEPGAYGQLGLADLFELREECLREFGFADVYRHDKARENLAALEALPDLLSELDALAPPPRLLALLQGVLAANIFDWGAKACVDMYHNATILEMYREARTKLSARPWRVDHLDEFAEVWFSRSNLDESGKGTVRSPYQRVIMFVDNAGADVVLGMLPLARELLKMGAEVVLVANSLPAINDVTAAELRSIVAKAAEVDPTIRAARDSAVTIQAANNGRIPPYKGFQQRVLSPVVPALSRAVPRPSELADLPAARSAGGFAFAPAPLRKPTVPQQFQLLGRSSESEEDRPRRSTAPHRLQSEAAAAELAQQPGPAGQQHQQQAEAGPASQQPAVQQAEPGALVHGPHGPALPPQQPQSEQQELDPLQQALMMLAGESLGEEGEGVAALGDGMMASPFRTTTRSPPGSEAGPSQHSPSEGVEGREPEDEACLVFRDEGDASSSTDSLTSYIAAAAVEAAEGGRQPTSQKGMFGESYPSPWRDPRLYIVASGHGSPCLDLRRVSSDVADACVGADLVIIEGMGRCIHTNYNAKFKCDALKLAMIKNRHLAQRLFGGDVYDCICRFDKAI